MTTMIVHCSPGVRCNQCAAAMINGVFCHETGCPNSRKTWIAERGEWVRFVECRECGDDVEVGESCNCHEIDWEPSSESEELEPEIG